MKGFRKLKDYFKEKESYPLKDFIAQRVYRSIYSQEEFPTICRIKIKNALDTKHINLFEPMSAESENNNQYNIFVLPEDNSVEALKMKDDSKFLGIAYTMKQPDESVKWFMSGEIKDNLLCADMEVKPNGDYFNHYLKNLLLLKRMDGNRPETKAVLYEELFGNYIFRIFEIANSKDDSLLFEVKPKSCG